jgi:hypothetical protein
MPDKKRPGIVKKKIKKTRFFGLARPFRGQETSHIKNYIEIESKTATLASS